MFDPANENHLSALHTEIANGYVTERVHPDKGSLRIYNYTKKAQYEGRWNDVTRQCRGLVVDWTAGGVVLARPFEKFFNIQEHKEQFDPRTLVEATDKMDGSLGILYPHPLGGYAIASRGSFTSEQAERGSEILQGYLAKGFHPDSEYTYLFEIIYPENRIVVNYGETEDLVLLDRYATDPTPSSPMPPDGSDRLPQPRKLLLELGNALDLPSRPNAEGWVLTFRDGPRKGLKVKIKQEDYVRLHRIVTGLNERVIWKHLSEGKDLEELLAELPEEFHEWVRGVAGFLLAEHERRINEAWAAFCDISLQFPDEVPFHPSRLQRSRFAQLAAGQPPHLRSSLFLILDGRWPELSDAVWRQLRL